MRWSPLARTKAASMRPACNAPTGSASGSMTAGTRSWRASSRARPSLIPVASRGSRPTRRLPVGASASRASADADIGTAGTATQPASKAQTLIHANVCVFHHLRHLGHFAADHLAELSRSGRRELEAERDELFAHVGHGDDARPVGVDLLHDGRRRAGGGEDAGPGGVIEAGHARLLHSW